MPLLLLFFFEVPAAPPSNIRFETTESSKLLVLWDPLPSEYHNGVLKGYKVYYYRKHYHEGERELTVGPSETYVVINETRILLEYEVWVSAFTSVGGGPKSEREEVVIG